MLITEPSGRVEEPDARLTRRFHRGNRLFGVETADVASITNSGRPLLQQLYGVRGLRVTDKRASSSPPLLVLVTRKKQAKLPYIDPSQPLPDLKCPMPTVRLAPINLGRGGDGNTAASGCGSHARGLCASPEPRKTIEQRRMPYA